MNLWQTARFDHVYKKLHLRSQNRVKQAITRLVEDPSVGEKKSGDLSEFFIYKFREGKRLWLLAYRIDAVRGIELVDLGSHENFYRGLRKLRGLPAKKNLDR
jgi:mRNA interferase RelE/StbE